MEDKLYKLYLQRYSQGEYITTLSGKDLNLFIAKTAGELNYGIFRTWAHGDKTFYDCGPVTYYTIPEENTAKNEKGK